MATNTRLRRSLRDLEPWEGEKPKPKTPHEKGDIRSHRGRVLRPRRKESGHLSVQLGRGKNSPIHHLVLEAFVGPRPEGMEALHYDDDPTNNVLWNLRWGTPSENHFDRVRNGRNWNANKTHCPRGHELATPNLVASVARIGRRTCLACARAKARIHRYPGLSLQLKEVSDSYYQALMSGDQTVEG